MRKLDTISFSGAGTQLSFAKGKLNISPRKRLPWMEFEVVLTLANSGSTHTLTDAEIKSFLAGWQLNLRYGSARRNPFNFIPFDRLRVVSRDQLGNDWPGCGADSTATVTGLKQSITGSGSITATFFLQVPLGYNWKDDAWKDLSGMGPAQVQTMSIDVAWKTSTLPAGITVTGNINMTAVMPERPARYEQWDYVPEYAEPQESSSQAVLQSGLALLVAETSAASASSSLSNVTISVNGEQVHDQVNAKEIASQYLSDPELPASGTVSDTFTVLLAYNSRDRLREALPGDVTVKQNTKDLSTMSLAHLYRPVISEQEVRNDVSACAKALAREVRAVYLPDAAGVKDMPASMKAFTPLALLDAVQGDSQARPALRATEQLPATPYLPQSYLNTLGSKLRNFKSSGNSSAIVSAASQAAASIPGGNTNPAQYRATGQISPSGAFDAVRGAFQG